MEQMYQTYREVADFRLIYIREAHAADGARPVEYAKELGIKEHRTLEDRCATAQSLLKNNALTIPCLIDNMQDQVNQAYSAWPDRVFVIRTDGRLAIVARPGPQGFAPALRETEQWLSEWKRTGQEPELSEDAADAGRPRHITEDRSQ